MANNITSIFQYQSSPVDWCEANYPIHANIVEFFNTISNVAFVILPLVFVWLHGNFRRYIDSFIPMAFMTQFFVGLGSAYFHATLSLFGQYMDELAIFYTMIAMWLIWGHLWLIFIFPRQARPLFYHLDCTPRRWLTVFRTFILCCLFGITAGCFFTPSANMYGLMIIGASTVSLFAIGVLRCECSELKRLGVHVVVYYLFAIALWCVGKFLCSVWSELGIGFLWHALWHVFICWATLNAFVVLAHHIACVKIAMGTANCSATLPRYNNRSVVGVRLMFWPHCLPDKTGWHKLTWLVRVPHVEPIFAIGDVQVDSSTVVQIAPDGMEVCIGVPSLIAGDDEAAAVSLKSSELAPDMPPPPEATTVLATSLLANLHRNEQPHHGGSSSSSNSRPNSLGGGDNHHEARVIDTTIIGPQQVAKVKILTSHVKR